MAATYLATGRVADPLTEISIDGSGVAEIIERAIADHITPLVEHITTLTEMVNDLSERVKTFEADPAYKTIAEAQRGHLQRR